MQRKLTLILTTLCCASGFCQDVQVQLSLENGKKAYRSGEPIRVVLAFTALRGNYMLNTGTGKPMSPVDEIAITPETGVDRWLDEYSGGHRFWPDGIPVTDLSAKPVDVVLVLNDCLRVDGPATYTIRITTRRVLPGPMGAADRKPVPPVTTNPVSFTVIPMTEEEEQSEIERLTAARRALNGANRNDRTAMLEADARQRRIDDELSYLSGDVSTRAKLSKFLAARGNLQSLEYPLFMARNRELLLDGLEKALRNPDVAPNGTLLRAAVRLRELAPKQEAVREAPPDWEAELIASLPQRTGRARTETLGMILQNLPKDRAQASKILKELREAMITGFVGGYPLPMLREYWDVFRDARLASGLEDMLKRFQKAPADLVWCVALERLMELAPDRARPFAVAEIIRAQRNNDFERAVGVLAALKETSLPEVDEPLLAIIREQAAREPLPYQVLAQKGVLAARFATDALYDRLLALYRAESERWQPEERGGVLSYLARVHEAETMPAIERELATFEPNLQYQAYQFLNFLTEGYYPPGHRAILAKRLESNDPLVAESAASLMGKHGGADDRAPIEKRLGQWRDTWRDRLSSASANDSRLESELVGALTSANAWKLSSAELESLREGCLTEMCRKSIPRE